MSIAHTHTFEVSQEDYNDGVRVRYCTFCPNVVFGNVDNATVKCLSCLPTQVPSEDPEGETTLVYRDMPVATYSEAAGMFAWTKTQEGQF